MLLNMIFKKEFPEHPFLLLLNSFSADIYIRALFAFLIAKTNSYRFNI